MFRFCCLFDLLFALLVCNLVFSLVLGTRDAFDVSICNKMMLLCLIIGENIMLKQREIDRSLDGARGGYFGLLEIFFTESSEFGVIYSQFHCNPKIPHYSPLSL